MPLFFIFVFSVKILPMTGVESRNIMAHKVTSLEFDFSNYYILASIRCTDFLDPNDDTIYQIETRIVMFNFTHCLFKFQTIFIFLFLPFSLLIYLIDFLFDLLKFVNCVLCPFFIFLCFDFIFLHFFFSFIELFSNFNNFWKILLFASTHRRLK